MVKEKLRRYGDRRQELRQIRRMLAELEARMTAPRAQALTGTPGDAVATFAGTRNAGFLVMGSHGYGRLKSLLLGSTALRIASQTKIPLLIVR